MHIFEPCTVKLRSFYGHNTHTAAAMLSLWHKATVGSCAQSRYSKCSESPSSFYEYFAFPSTNKESK